MLKMWLRSEKRTSRISRTTKATINLQKVTKGLSNISSLKRTCNTSIVLSRKSIHQSQQHQQQQIQKGSKKNHQEIQTKCNNKLKRGVKCVNTKLLKRCDRIKLSKKPSSSSLTTISSTRSKRATSASRRVREASRNLTELNKDTYCWSDGSTEEITLYVNELADEKKSNDFNKESNASDRELSDDDALNSFGPILVNETKRNEITSQDDQTVGIGGSCNTCEAFDSTSATTATTDNPCKCNNESDSKAECSNYIKCISECDSTTDNEQNGYKYTGPSTSNALAAASTLKSMENEAVDPEIDSTTDLISAESAQTEQNVLAEAANEQDSSKLTPNSSTTNFHGCPTPDLASCTKQFPVVNNNIISSCMNNNSNSNSTSTASLSFNSFANTPDLISLFDEEMNKSPSDMCQYTDFYPYNNVITQALFSCNEINQFCEQNDIANNFQTDLTFLSSMNQTAIDNLKALSNLQTHTTSFLTGMNSVKPSSSSGGETEDATCNGSGDSLIHSATASSSHLYQQHLYVQQQHHDDKNDNGNDIQLETDECMEIEEIHERHEELAWDAFDPYVFIKHLPPLTADMRAKCPALPLKTRSSPEFNLVLDLDETLVHCSLQELSDASFKFPVLFQVSAVECNLFLISIDFNDATLFFLHRIVNTPYLFEHVHFFESFLSVFLLCLKLYYLQHQNVSMLISC